MTTELWASDEILDFIAAGPSSERVACAYSLSQCTPGFVFIIVPKTSVSYHED
jgi:hypothetical protein